jgi:hypothetical protein
MVMCVDDGQAGFEDILAQPVQPGFIDMRTGRFGSVPA